MNDHASRHTQGMLAPHAAYLDLHYQIKTNIAIRMAHLNCVYDICSEALLMSLFPVERSRAGAASRTPGERLPVYDVHTAVGQQVHVVRLLQRVARARVQCPRHRFGHQQRIHCNALRPRPIEVAETNVEQRPVGTLPHEHVHVPRIAVHEPIPPQRVGLLQRSTAGEEGREGGGHRMFREQMSVILRAGVCSASSTYLRRKWRS